MFFFPLEGCSPFSGPLAVIWKKKIKTHDVFIVQFFWYIFFKAYYVKNSLTESFVCCSNHNQLLVKVHSSVWKGTLKIALPIWMNCYKKLCKNMQVFFFFWLCLTSKLFFEYIYTYTNHLVVHMDQRTSPPMLNLTGPSWNTLEVHPAKEKQIFSWDFSRHLESYWSVYTLMSTFRN